VSGGLDLPKGNKIGNRSTFLTHEAHIIATYGITAETYNALLQAQRGKCKICGSLVASKGRPNLCVDHDHVTGQIRGLLCTKCNILLGMASDNQTTLLRAIQYLKGNL
jgi:hypothetical protein